MNDALPFSYPFDLASLTQAAREETLTVPKAACDAIAQSYGVEGIEDFTARFRLTRVSKDEYALAGHFSAVILQTCVLTLKPMRTRTTRDFERTYDIVYPNAPHGVASATNVELESEDRETLQGTSLDLAVPLLEELSLSIDPYPKMPGVRFEGGENEPPGHESPFAVLGALKAKMESPEKT